MEEKIDAFHRRLQRYTIGIQWPEKITNTELEHITKLEPWSKTIKRRRLTFLGHIMRLHPDTPVKKAMTQFFTPLKNRSTNTHMDTYYQIRSS